jgi:3-oxoacyl-[acyl-carrier protein] reductase
MSRVVVVSGGGTGIGRAVAALFAADGDQVVILGRRADTLAEAADAIGGEVTPIRADLADPADAGQIGAALAERFGRVDVLVNNAGGNLALAPDTDPPADPLAAAAWQWLGNFRSNVLTAVLLTEAVTGLLADNGRIILISSIAALRGGAGSYSGAKAALHPYAYDLAAALGPRGITANLVAPGYIEDTEFFASGMAPQRRATLIGQTLNGRAGTVDDVAHTVHWLAAPDSGHITGQIIQVNGGALLGR